MTMKARYYKKSLGVIEIKSVFSISTMRNVLLLKGYSCQKASCRLDERAVRMLGEKSLKAIESHFHVYRQLFK